MLANGLEMAVTLLGVSATAIGAPLNPAYRGEEFRTYFDQLRVGFLIAATLLPPALRKPGSVGQSCGPELRILGPDGAALGAGEIGELALRGDNISRATRTTRRPMPTCSATAGS